MPDHDTAQAPGGGGPVDKSRVSGNFDRFNFVNATTGTAVDDVKCTLFHDGVQCDDPIEAENVVPGDVFSNGTVFDCGVTKIICTAKVNGANQNYEIDLGAPPFIRMATFGITEDSKGNIRPFGLLRLKGTTYMALQATNFV